MTTDPTHPAAGPRDTRGTPRRSPSPEERRRDADNSRRLLLAAALDEFAENGFAGARVQNIATRAGVNKQLISYYFDGKEGLYRGLQELWFQRENEFSSTDVALPELAARYLHDALAEPRMTRLLLWRGLSAGDGDVAPADDTKHQRDLGRMEGRKERGELAPELDPRAVLTMLVGAIMAPIALPQRIRMITGLDPASPEFEEFYAEQLRLMVRLLAGCPHGDPGHDGQEGHDGHDAGPDPE